MPALPPRTATLILEQLRRQLQAQLATLPLATHAGLVSLSVPLPQVPCRLPQLAVAAQFQGTYIHRRDWRAGYGTAAVWQASGHERLSQLAAVARDWSRTWQHADPAATGCRGFALLGWAATEVTSPIADESELPNALLWVPQVALRVLGETAAVICTTPTPINAAQALSQWLALLTPLMAALYPQKLPAAPLQPQARGVMTVAPAHTRPNHAQWCELVTQALAEIHTGQLDKVVLSRQVELTTPRPFDLERLHAALSDLFPSCQVLTLHYRGQHFVAATPERLLRLQHPAVEVDAIAGTTARATTAAQDAALKTALCRSAKNALEHQYVVNAVQAALQAAHCHTLQVPTPPQVLQLNNAQHLWTPVTATVPADVDVFTLAEQLHPTPATNGAPRSAAAAWLQAHEPFQRGWYTGVAGFVEPAADGQVNGELWVLLRCAHIRGCHAQLYAGAGIIAGSEPQTEWDETEAKLRAMLTALQFA